VKPQLPKLRLRRLYKRASLALGGNGERFTVLYEGGGGGEEGRGGKFENQNQKKAIMM